MNFVFTLSFSANSLLNIAFLLLVIAQPIELSKNNDMKCALQDVSFRHKVCVCNSTYCDIVQPVEPAPKGQYVVISSTRDGLRFNKKVLHAGNASKNAVFTIDIKVKRQQILGFGGAFTDAAGINIANLPNDAQKHLIASYYAKDGIEYTVGRVPMASCDFSTHPYSYNDVPGNLNLSRFDLAPEDLKYKIPYIQQAKLISSNPIRLFASPWSAPAWMKTNNNMTGKGALIGQPGGPYYKAWAAYYVKFLQSYQKHNITFWGLTTQNEPIDGLEKGFAFQAMAFTPETQRDFIKLDLGPALQAAGYENVSLMMLDDQRLFMLKWTQIVLSDPQASKYVSGIAVHWYMDSLVPSNVLNMSHNNFPDKFIFASEACEGSMPWQKHVDLGSWDRAASYAKDIITDLNNWVTGWTDWNLALSMSGGPNWVSNFVDSPIIVNSEKKEFYKQPMFYAMGHFSKFLPPGSVWVKIDTPVTIPGIEMTAFHRPDNSVAVVIHNAGPTSVDLTLTDGSSGYMPVTCPAYSIQTVLWW